MLAGELLRLRSVGSHAPDIHRAGVCGNEHYVAPIVRQRGLEIVCLKSQLPQRRAWLLHPQICVDAIVTV
jgi:hypothetical protein